MTETVLLRLTDMALDIAHIHAIISAHNASMTVLGLLKHVEKNQATIDQIFVSHPLPT